MAQGKRAFGGGVDTLSIPTSPCAPPHPPHACTPPPLPPQRMRAARPPPANDALVHEVRHGPRQAVVAHVEHARQRQQRRPGHRREHGHLVQGGRQRPRQRVVRQVQQEEGVGREGLQPGPKVPQRAEGVVGGQQEDQVGAAVGKAAGERACVREGGSGGRGRGVGGVRGTERRVRVCGAGRGRGGARLGELG